MSTIESERPVESPSPPSLVAGLGDRSWTEFAVCRGRRELFFAGFNERPSARARREARAQRLCEQCPVQLACRDAGRRNLESGIWGGETDEDRAMAGYAPRSISRRSVARARRAGMREHVA